MYMNVLQGNSTKVLATSHVKALILQLNKMPNAFNGHSCDYMLLTDASIYLPRSLGQLRNAVIYS